MRYKAFLCTLYFLLFASCTAFAQDKIIKSIKTEVYELNAQENYNDSVYHNGDTTFVLKSTERFNKEGDPVSMIEYYSNGKKKREDKWFYNDKDQLQRYTIIEYFGTGDQSDYVYSYTHNDSLRQVEIFDDGDMFLKIIYTRDSTGRLISQSNFYDGKMRNHINHEYYDSGRLFRVLKYQDSVQYSFNEKNYDANGYLVSELLVGEDLGWHCPDTCRNYYYYDSIGNRVMAKYRWESDSSYMLHTMKYHSNGKVSELRSVGIGCKRCTLSIDRYDRYGYLVSREFIPDSNEDKRGWYYDYEYDAEGNWTSKIETNSNGAISSTKRTIEYY